MSDFHIINDENFADYVQPDYTGFLPRLSGIGQLKDVPLFAESFELIPEQEWKPRVEQMTANRSFIRYLYEAQKPIHKNQNGLNYCWAYSLSQALEMVRSAKGLTYKELAPESLGALVGFSNAGYYCDKALEYAIKYGISTRDFIARYDLNSRNYKQGWQAEALKYCPTEHYDLGSVDMWKEVVTALLSGFSVYCGYNWWRHAVTLDSLVYANGELCVSTPNSWMPTDRRVLSGSRKIPDEAFAIRSCTLSV